jgi:hypothetical protein
MRPLLARAQLRFALFALLIPGLAAAAGAQISLQFRGSLQDGLKELASKGGINLVVTGDLSRPAELYLTNVSPEEALETVAGAYQLKIIKKNNIWTLRPLTTEELEDAGEEAAAPLAPPVPAAPPVPPSPRKEVQILRKQHGKGESEKVATGPLVIEAGEEVKSAVSLGGSVTLRPGAVVDGDVVAFGGDVILEAGSVVDGDAVAFGGQVKKAEGAEVEGDEVSMGGGALGAHLVGSISQQLAKQHAISEQDDSHPKAGLTQKPLPAPVVKVAEAKARSEGSFLGGVAWFLLKFALLFGLGFLFVMFSPSRVKQVEAELVRDPVSSVLTGLLGLVVAAVLGVVLLVTLIGIPVAIGLWVALGVAVAMGVTAIASILGLKLPVLRGRKTQALVLAIGLLVLLLAGEVPVLGPLAMSIVSLAGLGAIIRTRFGHTPKGFPEPDPLVS